MDLLRSRNEQEKHEGAQMAKLLLRLGTSESELKPVQMSHLSGPLAEPYLEADERLHRLLDAAVKDATRMDSGLQAIETLDISEIEKQLTLWRQYRKSMFIKRP